MAVSHDEVRRIAALARVGVPADRVEALSRELSGILEHMAVLGRVDTSKVESDLAPPPTPWREDKGPPIPVGAPLSAFAPEVRDGFFLVPRLATHVDEDGPAGGAP